MTDGHGSGLRARVRAISQRHEQTDERGFTLIEILIAVVLLGALTVGMVGSLYAITRISAQQRSISVAEAEGRRLVEQLRALQYVECPADAADEDQGIRYPLAFNHEGSSGTVTAEITSIEFWTGGGLDVTYSKSQPTFSATCTRDCGLQKLSLHVTAADSSADFVFYKRAEYPLEVPECLA